MRLRSASVHPQDLRICKKLQRELVVVRQIRPDHERRPENAPQTHHCNLLILRELCPRPDRTAQLLRPFHVIKAQAPDRQHVAVRPAPRRDLPLPDLTALEHVEKKLPVVPEVIGDTPEVCIFPKMPGLLDHRRARTQGEHHRPAAAINRLPDHLDLLLRRVGIVRVGVRVADVVHLHVVDAPRGVQLEDRVVVGLRALFCMINPVHIRVPAADRPGVGDLVAGRVRPLHGERLMHGKPRHAPHDVDAEFKPHLMDHIRKRFEALSAGRGRKSVRRGHLPPVFIEAQVRKRVVVGLLLPCRRLAPLDVADDVLPPAGQKVFLHIQCVCKELLLIYRVPEAVPAVPPHRRGQGNHVFHFHINTHFSPFAIKLIAPGNVSRTLPSGSLTTTSSR